MWDERYKTEDYVYGREPSQFLARNIEYLNAGDEVLSVADGEGRNSVFMAEQGTKVTAIDSSAVGLEKARRLAKERSVTVDFQLADLKGYNWGVEKYDVVAAIFIQFADPTFRAEIFNGMESAIKPGGLLMLHGYTPKQIEYGTGGPPDPELLYRPEMLAERFAGWEILRLEDYDAELQEGPGHSGKSALIDLIARPPHS
jgi:SAM-dependent methyltransferase